MNESPTITDDHHDMGQELGFANYRLVIEEQRRLYDILLGSMRIVGRRLTVCLGVSVALLAVLVLAASGSPTPTTVQRAIGVLAVGLFWLVIVAALDGLKSDFRAAGTTDWEELLGKYIQPDTGESLLQVIADLTVASESLYKETGRKADVADKAAIFLQGQAVFTLSYLIALWL